MMGYVAQEDLALLDKMTKHFLGKKNNPLTGLKIKEIIELGKKYGYDLKGRPENK